MTVVLATADTAASLLVTVKGSELGLNRDEFYVGEVVVFDASPEDAGDGFAEGLVVLTIRLPDGNEITPVVTLLDRRSARGLMETVVEGWHEWRIETLGGDGTLLPDSPILTPDRPLLYPDGTGGLLLPGSPLLSPDEPLLGWNDHVQSPWAVQQGRFKVLALNV